MAVGDAFIGNFNDPPAMWRILGSPRGAADWLETFDQMPSPGGGPG